MKKVLIALLLVVVVIGAGLTFFASKLDGLIAEQIETEGTAALGSKVSVTEVITSLSEGSAIVNGLTIANPTGYQSANAFEIRSLSAKVDYKEQVIEQITIDKPVINAEIIGTKNNFQDLLDNMPETADEPESTESGEDLVLTIKQIALKQATVNLRASDTKIADREFKIDDQTFVMDDLVMNNLSGTVDELSEEITRKLTNHVSGQVKAHVTALAGDIIKEELKAQAKEKVNEVLEDKLKSGKLGDKLKGLKFKL